MFSRDSDRPAIGWSCSSVYSEALFLAFPVLESELNPGVLSVPPPLTEKLPEVLLLLDQVDLFFPCGSLEPLFLACSLHNVSTRTKISEDFHMVYDPETL